MKKELVIIAGSCYPINSATGGLALKCAEYLDDYYNIRLIAIQEGNNYAYGKRYRNVKIYTLTHWRLKWAQISEEKIHNSEGIRKIIYKFSNKIARSIGRVQSAFFTLDNMSWFTKRAYDCLIELNEKEHIDAILSFNMPIEAHLAVEKYKEIFPEVRWVSYWGDLFANKPMKLNLFISIEKMRKIQKRLLTKSDEVLCTQEIYDELSKCTETDATPINAVPYVMKQAVLEEDCTKHNKSDGIVNFVYMGAFYRDIRNPEKMLRIFSETPRTYRLHMYSSGNCDDIVDRFIRSNPDKFIKHEQVSSGELQKILSNADVLVNIENSISNANPSKVIELISYRKPIIDFNYTDTAAPLLARYPLATNINVNHIGNAVIEIEKLVEKSKNITIEKDEIIQLYFDNTEDKAKMIVVSALK